MERGLRVLMLSKYDFAGSGFRLAEAVSLTTLHHVQHVALCPCPFPEGLARTPSLFKPDGNGGLTAQIDDLGRLHTLVRQADVLHFKGDDPPGDDYVPGLSLPAETPRVVTVSGKFFRRGASCVAEPMAPFSAYSPAALRTALTADLNYPEFDGIYTPQAYDVSAARTTWRARRIPLIVHSPSDRDKKGTSLLMAACELLRSRGVRFGLDIIENVDHAECLRRKARASVFVDQVNEVGFYGNAALEAMACGVPVVTHVSDEARARSGGVIDADCPIVDSGSTAKELANALERVLSSDMAALSRQTRQWAEQVHSYEAVGRLWDGLYRGLA